MQDKVKSALLMLMNAVQAGKIYIEDHPKFQEFITKSFTEIDEFLQDNKELIIGIVDDELAWQDEIFFDLSQKLKTLVKFFQECGIYRIVFQKGLRFEELKEFVSFLTRTKRQDIIDDKEYFSLHGIQNIRAGKMRALVKGKEELNQEIVQHYDNSLQYVTNSFNSILNEEEVDFLDLRFNILNIMENFVGKHQELLNLISVKDKDLITFVHLINVSLLSMFFASKLEFDKDSVLDIGIAALFHDIGKLSISKNILTKKAKLQKKEFAKIQNHPILGAQILINYIDTLGILPLVVAMEHHMRYDLSGYPKMAYPQKPHIASFIVSMCDVYDALAQKRTYKKDYPPNEIYSIMLKEKAKIFDPQLIDSFFKVMGVWPIGSIVRLSDDQVAVVREINNLDIFNPLVEILPPGKTETFLDLIKSDLTISSALNPFKEGKKYLDYI